MSHFADNDFPSVATMACLKDRLQTSLANTRLNSVDKFIIDFVLQIILCMVVEFWSSWTKLPRYWNEWGANAMAAHAVLSVAHLGHNWIGCGFERCSEPSSVSNLSYCNASLVCWKVTNCNSWHYIIICTASQRSLIERSVIRSFQLSQQFN